MAGRSIPEWVGATPDAKVPARVRQRVYERYRGACYLSGILIAGKPWELEHVKPLHMGGEHRESNLAPALKEHHAIKSAAEAKRRAKADRQARDLANNRTLPKQEIRSAGFLPADRRRVNPTPSPARRAMYEDVR